MIVRSIDDIRGTDAEVEAPGWTSRRLLLAKDGMGFSFHETLIHAGAEIRMQYRHHLESVYCIDGEGEVETLADGKVFPIRPGVIYALDRHDEHILRARSELRMACVFNPPVTGREVHDETGAYPAAADAT